MKALSLRQPWAWAVVHAGKRIENRVAWKGVGTRYRGPILIHAAKGCTPAEYLGAMAWMLAKGLVGDERPNLLEIARGGIIGRAELVSTFRTEDELRALITNGQAGNVSFDDQRRWWMGSFALVLANVEPLHFVPWKGALGLFEVPDDYATRAP